jgi:protein tyrosine phosphatase (PTP) superfamily phosphohydrolase (DUF442 family)
MKDGGKGRHALNPADRTTPPRRRRGIRWGLRGFTLLAAVSLTIVFRNPLFNRNFGVVDPGRVYRSAQPETDLADTVAGYGIASILNLRGGSRDDPYYANEVRLTAQRGIDFYDFPMSATRRPTRRELLVLLDLFERCRYPLLIHCKSGSDRTGLASALYLMAVSGKPPKQARRAFSVYYGHVPVGGTARLHEPFDEYQRWLASQGLSHSAAHFRSWVEHAYPADDRDAPILPLPTGPRPVFEKTVAR